MMKLSATTIDKEEKTEKKDAAEDMDRDFAVGNAW